MRKPGARRDAGLPTIRRSTAEETTDARTPFPGRRRAGLAALALAQGRTPTWRAISPPPAPTATAPTAVRGKEVKPLAGVSAEKISRRSPTSRAVPSPRRSCTRSPGATATISSSSSPRGSPPKSPPEQERRHERPMFSPPPPARCRRCARWSALTGCATTSSGPYRPRGGGRRRLRRATAARYLKMWGGNVDVTLVSATPPSSLPDLQPRAGRLQADRRARGDYDGLKALGVKLVQGERHRHRRRGRQR